MSSPQRSAVLSSKEVEGDEDDSCSDEYVHEDQLSSSDDTERVSISYHYHCPAQAIGKCRCESVFELLEDAGDHKPDEHGGQDGDAQMYYHPCPAQQPVWEKEKSGKTAWTDDLHRLYLNSIEEAFVKSLYDGAAYCCYDQDLAPDGGRWPADDVQCICSRRFNEEHHIMCPNDEDGLKDGENHRKRLRSWENSCTEQTSKGNMRRRRESGHDGELAEEEFGNNDAISTSNAHRDQRPTNECATAGGDSLEQILIFGVEEDQVVPSVGERGPLHHKMRVSRSQRTLKR